MVGFESTAEERKAQWLEALAPNTEINAFQIFYDEKGVLALEEQLERQGIFVKKLIGRGDDALIFTIEGMDGFILRVSSMFTHETLNSPVTLTAVYDHIFGVPGKKGDLRNVHVQILPVGEQELSKMGLYDLLRTASIAKAYGAIGGWEDGPDLVKHGGIDPKKTHWFDVKPDQIYYMRGADGKWLTYSDGHPIGFIGDTGNTTAMATHIPEMDGYPNAHRILAESGAENPMNMMIEKIMKGSELRRTAEEAAADASQKGLPVPEVKSLTQYVQALEPCTLFRDWDMLFRKLSEKDHGDIKVALCEALPQGWRQALRQIRWQQLTINGKYDDARKPELFPEDIVEKIEAIFAKAQVPEPPPSECNYTSVPLKLVDEIIPMAPMIDMMKCREQSKVIEDRLADSSVRLPSLRAGRVGS